MAFVYIAHNHNHWLLRCIGAIVKIDFVFENFDVFFFSVLMHSIDHKFVACLFVKECQIVAISRQNRIENQFANKNHLNRNHFDVFFSI